VAVGSNSLAVLHTPGHTAGSVCFYDEKGGNLFSGDTLFDGSYGRTDLPNSSARDMIESLARLAKLPPGTKVFPGHGETTTIGEQEWLNRR
jgi:glyoxylase-like metal-dependent hydrolase (beta-lactamase superfamily II)